MGINNRIIIVTILSAVFINLVTLCLPCFATNVLLQWDPSTDSSLAGYKVYYQADSSTQPFNGTGASEGASPIDVHNLTSTTITGLDPAHAYYFAITAYNTAGVESSYSTVVSVTESVAPTVSLLSPSNNDNLSGLISVIANASDNVGVSKVEFYVNGVLASSDTATPYLFSWNTTALSVGSYVLSAKAYDAAGNVGQSGNVTVMVVKDVIAPIVAITAPTSNTTVNGTVNVSVTASDNVGVTKVEFYVDGILSAAANTNPYSYSWNTNVVTNGSHALTAKAFDAAGNVSASNAVAVIVNNSVADTTAPTVSISAPAANAVVNGTVLVTANASDTVGVVKVEFYVNSLLKATDTVLPYNFSWDTTSTVNGTYNLTVKAYDAAGNSRTSSTVIVTVNNVTTQPQSKIPGDINNDGIVDVSDALMALQIAVGNVQPTADELQRGDIAPLINGVPVPNGIIDIGDVIVILSLAAGKIVL